VTSGFGGVCVCVFDSSAGCQQMCMRRFQSDAKVAVVVAVVCSLLMHVLIVSCRCAGSVVEKGGAVVAQRMNVPFGCSGCATHELNE
jgi:hypothetical protein